MRIKQENYQHYQIKEKLNQYIEIIDYFSYVCFNFQVTKKKIPNICFRLFDDGNSDDDD